ncbi:MAG: F0F1 ATP synthase subunit B [Clostridia bacterium]|nr:F0F1 ATP synthase subunit B [Clostridia bacterium]
MEFITIDKWTILFTWINLVILYLLMKKLLFKPVKGIIDARNKEIETLYSDAEKTKTEAEDMKADYTKKLSEAKIEAEGIIKDARKRASLDEERILFDAKAKANKMVSAAESQIEADKKNAALGIKDDIADMAIEIAEKVIEKDITESDHHRLIDGFLTDLGDTDE